MSVQPQTSTTLIGKTVHWFEVQALPTTAHGFDPVFPWLTAASHGNVRLMGKIGVPVSPVSVRDHEIGGSLTLCTDFTTDNFELTTCTDGSALVMLLPHNIASIRLNVRGSLKRRSSKQQLPSPADRVDGHSRGHSRMMMQTGPGGVSQLLAAWANKMPTMLHLYRVTYNVNGAACDNPPSLQSCRLYCEPVHGQ
jgi:hypothetical protein